MVRPIALRRDIMMTDKAVRILASIDTLIESARISGKADTISNIVAMHRRWLLQDLGVEFKDCAPLVGVEMEVGDE